MEINSLLEFIRCPDCGCSSLMPEKGKLLCPDCKNIFDIIEGVPVLLGHENLNEQEKSQKIWFDDHYSSFSDSEYRLERWRESMLIRVFDEALKGKIKTYLDIGCGATGYTVIEAAKRNGWTALGTDISLEAMIRAKKLAEKQGVDDKTAFVVCSAENLPLKNGAFEYISLISILEHLEKDRKAADEALRLLGAIGFIYICVPNAYFRIWPFLWPFYFWKDKKIGHKRHYSIERLDRLFTGKSQFKRHRHFYNGHLIKFYQIFIEKFGRINDKKWWQIEKRDINLNPTGVQLNVIYSNIKDS